MTGPEDNLSPAEPVLAYDPPRLTFIGNLHDVVAGTTQPNPCDAGALSPTGGPDQLTPGTPPFCP
jgi:hypothetical protein